jgi:hypothetical protein
MLEYHSCCFDWLLWNLQFTNYICFNILCLDVFANTNGNGKYTKGWNSNVRDTHAKVWEVGVRDDVGVEGDILKGEEKKGTR